MMNWGRDLYGNPCRECGYDWSISPDDALSLMAAIPARYAALVGDRDGSQRHPDLSWSAGAYVCHVTDNVRIWAERLAGCALGGVCICTRFSVFSAIGSPSASGKVDQSISGVVYAYVVMRGYPSSMGRVYYHHCTNAGNPSTTVHDGAPLSYRSHYHRRAAMRDERTVTTIQRGDDYGA